jgi:broad specificity phosphatase PhoE
MSRILLIRHGETEGNSAVRFYGATDVTLSDQGRVQMRAAARALPDDAIDLVVASPLSRAWEGARIVWPRGPILLEPGFREVDFGRWEGLTAEEIEQLDPPLHRAWRAGTPGFEYPEGERRASFRARVEQGLERMLGRGASSMLVVAHKGVIRTIVERLCGESPAEDELGLGGMIQLTSGADGRWAMGRRSSDPRSTA